jgi:DNA-binding CsgD family transcriptional regulator
MREGLASKTIDARLGLRLNTVRNHVQNLFVQLGAHSKLEAVPIATCHDLLGSIADRLNPSAGD